MGLFDKFFKKKKIEDHHIVAYNYILNFKYIPKQLYNWENKGTSLEAAINFDILAKTGVWKPLVKNTSVTSTEIDEIPGITFYVIQFPSTGMMGEVAMSMIAVNKKTKKYLFYTLEYSLGSFMICSADEKENHFSFESCKDPKQFVAYVSAQAMEEFGI